MLIVRDILRAKGSDVVTTEPEASVVDAMRRLVKHNIGALVVVSGDQIAGILTERDLLRAGAEDPGRLSELHVRDLMTSVVITGAPADGLRSVMDTMTHRRIRHLPVVEDGALCGIISIGDVINALRKSTETENRQLQAYISGVPS